MNQFCSKDNYLSLDAMESFAKYICTASNPCIYLFIRSYFERGVQFHCLYVYFNFNQEKWVYLGKTRKLKKIPSSRYLKILIHEVKINDEVEHG